MVTCAPAPASSVAMSRPIPVPPPVTSACVPLSIVVLSRLVLLWATLHLRRGQASGSGPHRPLDIHEGECVTSSACSKGGYHETDFRSRYGRRAGLARAGLGGHCRPVSAVRALFQAGRVHPACVHRDRRHGAAHL